MITGRKIRMGMVGGGEGAFIGNVHRMAAMLDGEIELVCGAFSSNADRSQASGKALYLPQNRIYDSYEDMIVHEQSLPEGERMDFVAIVTPNFLHFEQSKLALENGFHVVCDKPATITSDQAKVLKGIVEDTGLIFCLTHNYTGYPMVKQAKHMIANGELGAVRKVVVEYPQGWLTDNIEQGGQKQASWRTDPDKAGISCCMGDIGSHAENLAEYITGLKISALCADLSTIVQGRALDDDGNVLLRFDNGANGVLFASQVATGEENELKIRVYGEKGGLEWLQSDPNKLVVKWKTQPMQVLKPGVDKSNLSDSVLGASRLPAGHPEGYIEAFANLYKAFARSSERDN